MGATLASMRIAIGGTTGALLLVVALGCGAAGCGNDELRSPRDAAISSPFDAAITSPLDAAITSSFDGEILCTLVGCEDEFTATVTVDATMVAAGTHTVDVMANGTAMTCTFSFPPDPALGGTVAQCSSGVALVVGPAETCTTTQTDAAISEQCQPISGKFTETISVDGIPSAVHVQQLVGGTVILDETVSPTYQTNQPNGPNCGPICQQGNATWTIPQ
jgi:hypothetical protein